MHGLQRGEVQFSESDFRQYNPAGYQELLTSLVAARQKAEAAASVEEKKVAQIHLESVEQLWRLSLQLAKERFEHARDSAYKEVRGAWDGLRLSGAEVPRQELQAALEQAATAFHRKDFLRAQELAGGVSRAVKGDTPELRLVPAVRPAPASALAPEQDVVELLEKALEYERSNRMAQAYRMYLRVLERQPGNAGARQRLRVVRGQAGGRA
jgi:hypothetical protein